MSGITFDGCTEIIFQAIVESSPAKYPDAEKTTHLLSAFQKACMDVDLCPKGEMVRGLMCRDFLRDAVLRMKKKKLSISADAPIGNIMEITEQFIENYGEESEAERAYIVVRNLIIIAENMAKQVKKQMLPTISKQPVQLTCYHIDLDGVREFEEIAGVKHEKEIEKLFKPKLTPLILSPMTSKQECEVRYRNLFFNMVVKLITIKEIQEGEAINDSN